MPFLESFLPQTPGRRLLSFFYYSPLGHLSLLAFFGLFHFFWGLDAYGLMHNNEGLYAEIPREMINLSQFIIPPLNGVPYIEKPPLLYWLIAIVYKVNGISVQSARLIPALAGFLTCGSLYIFGRKQGKPLLGLWSALILLGSGAFVIFSRMVYFEGLLTFFLSSALLCFYQGSLTYCRKWLTLSYGLLALGILTKGFVALILYGCVVIAWTLYQRSWALLKWLFSLLPLALLGLFVLPWHIMASFQEPDFAWFYFINEHILRFLGKREPKDYYHGPLYYYIPRLLLYGLPWTFLVFPSLKFKNDFSLQPAPLNVFLTLWIVIFFLFFSLSEAKANYYIMTILPPLAFLMAGGLLKNGPFSLRWIASVPLLFASLLGIGTLYGCGVLDLPLPLTLSAVSLALGLMVYLKKTMIPWLPLILTFQVSLLIQSALQVVPSYEPLISAHPFKKPEGTTCLYKDFEKMSSVVFYGETPMPLYQSQSNDLAFGLKKVPDLNFNLPIQAQARCNGFFVYDQQWPSFEKEFSSYTLNQEVGRVRYYTRAF